MRNDGNSIGGYVYGDTRPDIPRDDVRPASRPRRAPFAFPVPNPDGTPPGLRAPRPQPTGPQLRVDDRGDGWWTWTCDGVDDCTERGFALTEAFATEKGTTHMIKTHGTPA